ncbi:splicing factor, arginine/serine-rich 19-like isoform X2 [Protopterus annectens]|uniref:splicing factor, arginine/serine-rich 19-like isoform X2 n=1 Tax=Protopterus annectens TaxID=7888 RepID=UPI001CF9F89F|nr:splicing factor, arginine/serine-rich 19-like isoform X2 [Protopterus annectens]
MVGFQPKLRSPQWTPEKGVIKCKQVNRKKTCWKKIFSRVTDQEGENEQMVSAETESGVTDAAAALLSIITESMNHSCSCPEPVQSRLSPDAEPVPSSADIEYEDFEFELVAEVHLSDSVDSLCSLSRFGRVTNWRNKSAFLELPSCQRRKSLFGNSTSNSIQSLAYRNRTCSDLLQNLPILCSSSLESMDCLRPERSRKSRTVVLKDVNLHRLDVRTKGTDIITENKWFPSVMSEVVREPHLTVEQCGSDSYLDNSYIFEMGKAPMTFVDSLANRLAGDEKKPETSNVNDWAVALGGGSGVSNGHERPLTGEGGSTSGSQPSQSFSSTEEIADSNPSFYSQNVSTTSSAYSTVEYGGLDIYDPFHPTDEENGEMEYEPEESAEEQLKEEHDDQKYDPFEPTGSNPSSPESNSALNFEKESSQDMETNTEMHVDTHQESSEWCIPSSEEKEEPMDGFAIEPSTVSRESIIEPLTPTDAYSPSAEYASEEHEGIVEPLTPTDAYSPSTEYISEAHESTAEPLTPTDAYSPSAEYISEEHDGIVEPLTPTDAYSPSIECVSDAHESVAEPLTPTDAYSPSAEFESVPQDDTIEPLSPTEAYSPSVEYASVDDSGIVEVEPLTPTDAYSPIEVEDLSSDSAPEDEASCQTGIELSPVWKSDCNQETQNLECEPVHNEERKEPENMLSETAGTTEEPCISPVPVEENTSEQPEPSLTPEKTKVISLEIPASKKEQRTHKTSESDHKTKKEVRVSPERRTGDGEEPEHKPYSRPQRMTITITDTRSRHKSRHFSDRRDEGDYLYVDSEIEEGEIVQPEEDRFSPVRTFRSRGRISDRPIRVVEGDDFLSLHADSDEERALQIDFADGQSDTRWKGIDLRRKITNQRRERYRKRSRSKTPVKKRQGSRSASSSRSRKKAKKARNRSKSVERKHSKSKEARSKAKSATRRKKSKSRDRKQSGSKSRRKVSRSHSRDHRRSRSWSPSLSTSVSIVDSSRTSAERRRSRRSRSKGKVYPKSRSASDDRARKNKYRDKHHADDKSHKRKRSISKSRDRERRSDNYSRRSKERHEKDKDLKRDRYSAIDRKPEISLTDRRRDSRGVVPPSIQDLNDDLYTIKRTITVNRDDRLDDHSDLLDSLERGGRREVLYDSEGLSFETSFSDREHPDDRDSKGNRLLGRHLSKLESGKRRSDYDKRWKEEDYKLKLSRETERKRSRGEEKSSREKRKKKVRESVDLDIVKAEKERVYTEKEKTGKKIKSGHKNGKEGPTRKVKLQSKVAVLIREGVSSTTSVKEAGSIGVKFSRDRESRSPFIKSEENVDNLTVTRPKMEIPDTKEVVVKPKKVKIVKVKTGVKKVKAVAAQGKLKGPEKKKKKLKPKGTLKKSKADSCSKEPSSPAVVKAESPWSDSEKSDNKGKPPSPPKAANEQELTPDSQTVDSSCKTPDVSLQPEEPKEEQKISEVPVVDSLSEVNEEQARSSGATTVPWNLQTGMDTASGVLALTALLFKMEQENLASRAKAKELILNSQILNPPKPSTPLSSHGSSSAFVPTPQPTASYALHSSLPLTSSSTPSTPLDIPSSVVQTCANTSGYYYTTSSNMESAKDELGLIYPDGKADADKYMKKLHMQERAIEEVKLAIKPYYQKKEVNKNEYKDILRKAVHKICHSRSGEINPVKVNNLIKAYVQRYKYFRKHGRKMDEEDSGRDKFPLPPM